MTDFNIVDLPGVLAVKSTISDGMGNWSPDPDWTREAAESQFLLAEMLASERLLTSNTSASRSPDLVIRWSELTETGQAFVSAHYDKWMRSIDRSGMTQADKRKKLFRRWDQFAKAADQP